MPGNNTNDPVVQLVSVIMPVFNGGKYVRDSMVSLQNQSYQHIEIIVINDGSVDDSLAQLQSMARTDPRIVVLDNSKNIGLVRSLNIGLRKAKGEFVARMDCDDVCLPERIEKQVEYLNANPDVDLCGSAIEFFGQSVHSGSLICHPLSHKDIAVDLLFQSCIMHPTVMFRRKLLDVGLSLYDERYSPVCEDYELWIRLVREGYRLANMPDRLLMYRWHPENISSELATEQERVGRQLIQKQLEALFASSIQTSDLDDFLLLRAGNPVNPAELSRLVDIVNRMLAANMVRQLYDHNSLAENIYSRLYRIARKSTRHGVGVWISFRKCRVPKPLDVGFRLKTKLFLKSLWWLP